MNRRGTMRHCLRRECQFRVFFDGETFEFCEDDDILGGIAWVWNTTDFVEEDGTLSPGWTLEDAIADAALIEDRVWLGRAADTRSATVEEQELAISGPVNGEERWAVRRTVGRCA